MTLRISDTTLSELSEFVAARLGLHFPKERWRDLARGLNSAARDFEFADGEACARWLLSATLSKSQLETLARHLTVGETYFFREEKSLDALTNHILPELVRSRRESERRLRVWSAGCSTGEEAYTLAILLDRLLPDIEDWQVTILATDINARSLGKASEGVYGEWSFRGTPAWVKAKYFERKKGDAYEIIPRIRRMVKFSPLNLAEDAFPALWNNTNAMDAIFCRNVLMYFAPEQKRKVVRKFSHALVNGGWFVVSLSELSNEQFTEFASVNFPGAILYQKRDAAQAAAQYLFQSDARTVSAHPLHKVNELVAANQGTRQPTDEVKETFSAEMDESGEASELGAMRYADALTLYMQGRYREAADLLLRHISDERGDTATHVLLARGLANQGELPEALRWCEKAIALDKTRAASHYLRATILQEQLQMEEATRSLRRALFLDQRFVLAHYALGNIMRQQGKLREAEKHFENALALLRSYSPEEALPESDGLTAGRLSEIIRSTNQRKASA